MSLLFAGMRDDQDRNQLLSLLIEIFGFYLGKWNKMMGRCFASIWNERKVSNKISAKLLNKVLTIGFYENVIRLTPMTRRYIWIYSAITKIWEDEMTVYLVGRGDIGPNFVIFNTNNGTKTPGLESKCSSCIYFPFKRAPHMDPIGLPLSCCCQNFFLFHTSEGPRSCRPIFWGIALT